MRMRAQPNQPLERSGTSHGGEYSCTYGGSAKALGRWLDVWLRPFGTPVSNSR